MRRQGGTAMAALAAAGPVSGDEERRMTLKPAPPQIIVVFGASGDLARRKILPALYSLSRKGLLPERHRIVGYARTQWDSDKFREFAHESIEELRPGALDEEMWKLFADSLE